MAGVPDRDMVTFEGFPLGINNRTAEESAPPLALRAAKNVDLDDAGKPRRRPGANLVVELEGLHSLWAHDRFPLMLGVDPLGGIVAFDQHEAREPLSPALQRPDLPMSWDLVGDTVYASNGSDRLQVLDNGTTRPWCAEHPAGQPLVAPATGLGGLDAGLYQVAITFIDTDGRESGATLPVEVELEQGQGISLTAFPVPSDPRTAMIRVYCSPANGTGLYAAQDLPVGLTTFVLGAHQPGAELDRLFLTPTPAGHIVRAYGGRLYVAVENVMAWSEALAYGLTRASTNWVRHDGRLALIEPSGKGGASGLFVATAPGHGKSAGRTYFLGGPDPKAWQRVIAYPHGAVPGSSAQLPGEVIGQPGAGIVPVWLADNGQIVAGLPSGAVIELHGANYVAAERVEHASLALREAGNLRHLIASLRGGQRSGLAAIDTAEAEVWKGGVRIR